MRLDQAFACPQTALHAIDQLKLLMQPPLSDEEPGEPEWGVIGQVR
jgi:hypothetical protein